MCSSDLTLSGMVMDDKLEQEAKAWCPMIVTLSGMEMADTRVQDWKASSPTLVTMFGMVRMVLLEHGTQ